MKDYTDLNVWKLSIDLVTEVYVLTEKFPASQKFSLVNQMQRAITSVPSNIAEGSMRRSKAEFARFVNISCGSLAEVHTQLVISRNLGFISEQTYKNMFEKIDIINKMLYKLHQSLVK